MTAGKDGGAVSVLLGNGNGTFGTASVYDAGVTNNVAVADFNGDGKVDIVAGSYVSHRVLVLLGNGNGTFGAASGYYGIGEWAYNPYDIAAADLNGDGKIDIATVNRYHWSTVSVLLNTTSGGTLVASGALSITDPDPGQSSFVAQSGTLGNHGYGSFNITAAGAWSYSADNNQSAIQALNAGQTLTDSFTVASFDGSATQDVTVTIIGVNG